MKTNNRPLTSSTKLRSRQNNNNNNKNKNENNSTSNTKNLLKINKNKKNFPTKLLSNNNNNNNIHIVPIINNDNKNENFENNFDNNNNNNNNENFENQDEINENNNNDIINNFSKTLPNIRPKTANNFYKNKNKIKLLSSSPLAYEKKIHIPHLIPPIPSKLFDLYNLFHSIFDDFDFQVYVSRAPPRKTNSIETVAKYLYDFKFNNQIEFTHYATFFYYLTNEFKPKIFFNNNNNNNNNEKNDLNNENKISNEFSSNIKTILQKENVSTEKDLELIFKNEFVSNFQIVKIFESMCKICEMKYRHIKGFCKLNCYPKFLRNSEIYFNHVWNAILIQNDWYLIDVFHGLSKPKNEYEKTIEKKNSNDNDYFSTNFNPFFFMTPPNLLIESHLPFDDFNQLTNKIIPNNFFIQRRNLKLNDFYKNVYKYKIELLTHVFPVIHSTKNLVIKLKLEKMLIQVNLFNFNFKYKISEVKFGFNDKTHVYSLEPHFPENGEYFIQINFRPDGSENLNYSNLINYKLLIDDSREEYIEKLKRERELKEKKELFLKSLYNNNNKRKRAQSSRLPKMGIIIEKDKLNYFLKTKKYNYDSNGAHLYQPRNGKIRIGNDTNFRVKIPDSIGCIILDNKKWNYLKKREKDIYEGVVNCQNENIIVCSVKNNNVVTEVFHLKGHYADVGLMKMKLMFKKKKEEKEKKEKMMKEKKEMEEKEMEEKEKEEKEKEEKEKEEKEKKEKEEKEKKKKEEEEKKSKKNKKKKNKK